MKYSCCKNSENVIEFTRKLPVKEGIRDMQVWRIKRLETDEFIDCMYGTRIQAAGAMVRMVEFTFWQKGYDRKKRWDDISPAETVRLGEYFNEEYGFHWKVVEYDYIDFNKKFDIKVIGWHDNIELMEDGTEYTVELINGDIVTGICDSTYGLLCSENNILCLEDVKRFQGEVTYFETACRSNADG